MHAAAFIVMILGIVGFILTYTSILAIAPLVVWAGIAGAGMLVTVLTRRPSD